MLIAVYLTGILTVVLFIACCGLARGGAEWARVASWVGVCALLGIASLGLLLAFVLMLAGGRENGSDDWWSQGLGQQFLAAALGWLALGWAGLSVRQRLYETAAVFVIAAAILFGLWGLLVDAGWSNQGPLAFIGSLSSSEGWASIMILTAWHQVSVALEVTVIVGWPR